ncbi:glycosyltransferase family 39 protein, partial [Streptococcus sp. DD11]|uniref:glycosyltransferase family 39 protein n=1 Tax=Streptococcus sp. DD11 TaxID=1777879 RepID=UPI00100844CD
VSNPWYFYPLLLLFLLGLFLIRPLLEKLSGKHLFLGLSLLFLAAAIFLITSYSGRIRADARHVFYAAIAFNQGDYSSLTTVGSYLYRNPHQLGLMTLERLYAYISPTTQFAFVMNILWTLLSNFLIYKITALLTAKEIIQKYTILLTFLFLPQLFFVLFVYGTIPGLFFCLLSLYAFIQLEQKGRLLYALLGAASIGMACLLRNNYMIFALMLMGVCLLSAFYKWAWKKPLAIVLIAAGIVFPGKFLTGYYENLIGQSIGEGTPKIAYITMGLRDDPNRQTLGGWYDAYNTKILKRNQYNEKQAREMATRDLKDLLIHFIKNPGYALKFFYEKVKSTWTEPTFQSVWTGPQIERQQYMKPAVLRSIYEERAGYQLVNFLLLILLAAIYLLSCGFVLRKYFIAEERLRPFDLYPFIFLLGGGLFHFFWETKSQYVYIYVLLLIPAAAQSLVELGDWWQERKEKRTL